MAAGPEATLSEVLKPVPGYYNDAEILKTGAQFKDFDNPHNFKALERSVSSATSRNFVIDFGDEEAWCAFDLDAGAIQTLVKTARPPNLNTRWINIWLPYNQVEILKILAKQYDFSPRLLGVMCTQPPPLQSSMKTPAVSEASSYLRRSQFNDSPQKSEHDHSIDLEMLGARPDPSPGSIEAQSLRDMNHYKLADEVWHWSSVDWGRKYVCVGYNSLYNVRPNQLERAEGGEGRPDLPGGQRVWTWLLLLSDRTVVSINEDPFPYRDGDLDHLEITGLAAVRRNLVNVFRQLSKAHDLSKQNPINSLPVRQRVGDTVEETLHRPIDAPGLLFYCLFDDSITSYSLVARREHQYGRALDSLRQSMLTRAQLGHVNQLFNIGRQLAVLKRIYQSYELIIERLLDREKQRQSAASIMNSSTWPQNGVESGMSSHIHIPETESTLGVSFSSAARVRLERMRDRIRLYALSEIQECVDQKESLVMMNFNLIAIKESYSVERLTRVTLLLTKVTFIFLPISIMTGYFSTQLKDVVFTLRDYWITFGVILGVALVGMLLFGFYSGTNEAAIIYRPLSRKLVDLCRQVVRERKSRKA